MPYNILHYDSRVLIYPIQAFVILGVGWFFNIFNNILKYLPKWDFFFTFCYSNSDSSHPYRNIQVNAAIISTDKYLVGNWKAHENQQNPE